MTDYRTGCPDGPLEPPERANQEEINRYFYRHCGFPFLDILDEEDEDDG